MSFSSASEMNDILTRSHHGVAETHQDRQRYVPEDVARSNGFWATRALLNVGLAVTFLKNCL